MKAVEFSNRDRAKVTTSTTKPNLSFKCRWTSKKIIRQIKELHHPIFCRPKWVNRNQDFLSHMPLETKIRHGKPMPHPPHKSMFDLEPTLTVLRIRFSKFQGKVWIKHLILRLWVEIIISRVIKPNSNTITSRPLDIFKVVQQDLEAKITWPPRVQWTYHRLRRISMMDSRIRILFKVCTNKFKTNSSWNRINLKMNRVRSSRPRLRLKIVCFRSTITYNQSRGYLQKWSPETTIHPVFNKIIHKNLV